MFRKALTTLALTGAIVAAPTAAFAADSAPIVLGGQELSVASCDVKVVTVIFDPSNGGLYFEGASLDC